MRNSRYLVLGIFVVVLSAIAACGGEAEDSAAAKFEPEDVIATFAAHQIPLVIGRDRRNETGSILVAILDPNSQPLEGKLAVDLFRSEREASDFVVGLSANPQLWPEWIQRENVVAFYKGDDRELTARIHAAMDDL